mgnify:CR=1 FL=1
MFLAKIKNEKRSESYFIEAVSYTDAEEIIASEFPYATIKAISGQKFSFVLKSDVEEDDRFFKCKIASISDEGTKSTMTALSRLTRARGLKPVFNASVQLATGRASHGRVD